MGEHIKAEGWHNWDKHASEGTTSYSEYKSEGPGADTLNRVSWSNQLTDQEAEQFTVQHILSGEDGWTP